MAKPFQRVLIAAVLIAAAAVTGYASVPFDIAWQRGEITAAPGAPFENAIKIRVPPGYAIDDETLDIEFISLEGIHIDAVDRPTPNASLMADNGAPKDVHDRDVLIPVAGHVPSTTKAGAREVVARLSFRGCIRGSCQPLEQRDVALTMHVQALAAPPTQEHAARGKGADTPDRASNLLERFDLHGLSRFSFGGTLWSMVIVFLAGVLTSLTPCLWPVIPVMLLVIGVTRQRGWLGNLALAAALVAGLVPVYAAMGIVAVAVGRNLGFMFQQPWFLAVVVAFFVMMALSLFGVYDIRLPSRWSAAMHRLGGRGYRGAFLSGLSLGLIVSPCAAPVVAALLGHVALQGNYAMGFALLVVYGLGMGALIVAVGAAFGVLADRLRGGAWMPWMKRTLGVILLIPAAFYASALFNPDGRGKETPPYCISWIDRFEDGLMFAKREGRPLMVDFYADWCTSCRLLDRGILRKPALVELSYRVVPVRVDATRTSATTRSLFDRFRIVSLPTIIFLAPSGEEYGDLRVLSPTASAIEASMRAAIDRAGSHGGGDAPREGRSHERGGEGEECK